MAATASFLPPLPRSSSPSSLSPQDDTRQSIASTSVTSFLTAPQTAEHSRPASTRSTSTVGPSSSRDHDMLNPLHAMAVKHQPQEVHILKVTDDVVHLQSGPVPESILHKVGNSIANAVSDHHQNRSDSTDSNVGPPPPSPPPSTDQELELDPMAPYPSSSTTRPVTFEDPIWERQASTSSTRPTVKFPSPTRAPLLTHRASADTKSSLRTSDTPFTDEPDGLLHPPPHKPSRRNTISASSSPHPMQKPVRMMTMHSVPHGSDPAEVEGEFGGLASDIQQQAEQIRRERLSKRAKAEAEKAKVQQDAERALTRTTSVVKQKGEQPLVGNLIGEDHVNYVLMYNMLTGIRIAVSRCQAKIRRPLTDDDFAACHKFSFDIVGNELTPSAKYDFKFKDYAPWVFRELREDYFHLDPADYLLSLTAKYILSELGSPGKSGSFFYFSRDYRFIIKTIHHNEHKFLRNVLKKYHEHVKSNPHTLISRFYGLHRVKLPRGRKIHFVIMNNLFPPHKDIHETFDLKGSTVGREYPEEKAARNPRAVMKDLNWINRGKTLELGPEKRALLTEQLRRDSELLKELHVMDYSLLVGIHHMKRGNRDNVRSNTLKVFSPEVSLIRRKTQVKGPSSPEAIAMRRIMRESDPQRLGSGTIKLPDEDTGERQHFIFYQNEGGLRATDEANAEMDTIYYLGVIDILTPYNSLKKVEHFWKGLSADRHKISPVPPTEYGERFFSFMKACMRGGEGYSRFKSE
ncbi:hypothetical protein QCA50_011236 [Cerrena zonata]|uniref:1-phosphatidylinositol-4-phosphate 5-kinase n=1 Tax=Cerrena zonata TaxID=2478898 RepID=A0AAW0G4Y3_9APHY